jgi:SAM-dependent methyltransferase
VSYTPAWLDDAVVERDHPYACPLDRTPLRIEAGGITCPKCGAAYAREGGIALLDVILSAQAAAFDAQHASPEPMSEAARRASVALAERFLDAIAPGAAVAGKDILEVACGGGALTYGLAHTERIRRSTIHGFDHSIASLAAVRASVGDVVESNRVVLSAQDVHALAYRERTFDLVIGNAVLHHFSGVGNVIGSLGRLLRPGGIAVFGEPFAHGYVLATAILVQSARLLGMELTAPGMGLAQFIVDDVAYRVRHAGDDAALERLTDKHLFTTESIAEIAVRHGLGWRTVLQEKESFYERFMKRFLDEYGIRSEPLRATALQLFDAARLHLGPSFAEYFPHFKLIVFEAPAQRGSA